MKTQQEVQDYYGKQLQNSNDLKTNACCDPALMPEYLKPILAKIHPEVDSRYYGCGLVIPPLLEGLKILDLGSGAGRDVYLLSALVGETGQVVGIDMTQEQLAIANEYKDFHAEQFQLSKTNVQFIQGYLETLDELGLEESSFDIIVSNCVLNLSTDKLAVLQSAYKLLKPGGEFYFSDVYADRRIPQALQDDPVLYGECLSGALYWNDFLNLSKQAGFLDPRLSSDRPLTIENSKLENKVSPIKFYSATYRLFKINELESDCEDYGQAVKYLGGIPEHDTYFDLDGHHRFEQGKVEAVCGNTLRMLKNTRFKPYFEFYGNWQQHFGLFEGCGKEIPFQQDLNEQDCC
ncbi:similar to 2-polyprenyl-3-methyl-5-hydroxy-6-metoxy-1, 4-benz oquinol methylase [Oleispira antarctica RB-8]|uniref:Arsenite methyltransferase n=1 Tax=Oleispira antarctica RB-8 TaxID=698738 RepID=R4YPN3_OLEAN|nr:similar to 2-polyprenyl-3-methyl-5-hydroxy-6-metoxy-1, 4-benz oquinol methylase [Oleispira antarctica RB-8]|tara:strand:+ start:1998 stop:3041 length:1044 start_codon:yes stop_codon:yes gene_type:complete